MGAQLDVFELREKLIADYSDFTRSFTRIQAEDIRDFVDREYASQKYWPAPWFRSIPASRRVPPWKSW